MAKLKKVLVTVVTSLRRNKNAAFRKFALFMQYLQTFMEVLYIFVLAMVLVCHPYLHIIIEFSEQTNNALKFLGSYLVVLITIFGVKL